ncbi:MAG: hydrolase [Angelakisella sp.]
MNENDYRQQFETLLRETVKRDGLEELLAWLAGTDFYTAPASTKYHCACPSGLVIHSLSVYQTMMDKQFEEGTDSRESFTLCALLHDLCKAQFYKIASRNVKNDKTGQWEKKAFYQVEDSFPYGHGEKSVYLIERFLRLRPAEATAIRWHMGGFDEAVKGGSFSISLAFEKYPLAVKLHLADLESTYLRERGTSEVN